MVRHTQTTRRQKPTNCLSVFDHFMGLALKELKHSNLYKVKKNLKKERQKEKINIVVYQHLF